MADDEITDVSEVSYTSPTAAKAAASKQTTTPVPGNGVVEIILPDSDEGKKKMALDLPEGVGQVMMTETAGNIQASNRNSRNVGDIAMGALQGTMVANFKDTGLIEGRTASGILATPIAGPANAQK